MGAYPTKRDLTEMGYDGALREGFLGIYMEHMNRGRSGGYSDSVIAAAKADPARGPLAKKG